MYNLAQQLNRNNKDMLWWWCVGIADQSVHAKATETEQSEELNNCNLEVQKMHPIP